MTAARDGYYAVVIRAGVCGVGNPLVSEFPVPACSYSPIGSVQKVLACAWFLLEDPGKISTQSGAASEYASR